MFQKLSLTPKFVCFCFPLFGVMFTFSTEVFYSFRGLEVCWFCAGFVYHLLQFFWIFEHWARTQMIVVKWLIVMVSHKQWLAQCIKHAHFFNVCTWIMDKYAWLCISICINMEVISSAGNTSSYKLSIILVICPCPSVWKDMRKSTTAAVEKAFIRKLCMQWIFWKHTAWFSEHQSAIHALTLKL